MRAELTHGEAWFKATRYENLDLRKEVHDTVGSFPKRMPRAEAVVHYNTKLFNYWIDHIDPKLKTTHRRQILKYLMFRDAHSLKLKEV